MKKLKTLIFIFATALHLAAQSGGDLMQGTISYVSSQHAYVKFHNTALVSPGDTLFSEGPAGRIPVLRVKTTSSISCICEPVEGYVPVVGDAIIFTGTPHGTMKGTEVKATGNRQAVGKGQPPGNREASGAKEKSVGRSIQDDDQDAPGGTAATEKKGKFTPAFRGKVGLNAFSGFSEYQERNYLRLRYRLTMDAAHIGGSPVSVETYLTFNHRAGKWNEVRSNLSNGLKVYNLNVSYQATPSTHLLAGRAMNRHIANIGAVDGIQVRQDIGKFTLGGIAGTRPDFEDYGFNARLLQFGGYLSHTAKISGNPFSNSIAFMEQKNGGFTDRRFLYFQHSSSVVRDLYLFSSFEADLFEVRDSAARNTFGLTSLYLLLRYNISKNLSVSASYDLRNNVIYYETYRNYIDRLIEEQTRQGLNASIRYRVFDFMTVGLRGSYRYRKDDPVPAGNYSAYLYFNQLPAYGMQVQLTYNLIRTAYLSGTMAGIRINQELAGGKLNGGIHYRIFDGQYAAADTKTLHHITELQLRWNIYRKLSVAASYEAMLENGFLNNRICLLVSQRF